PYASPYFTDMYDTSGSPPFHSSEACVTLGEYSVGDFSQIHGIAAALSVIILSICPHSDQRFSELSSTFAFSMSALIFGSFSCDQLTLFAGRMFLPLKFASRSACGSWKSASHPTFGQMFGAFFGTPQKRVYIAECWTEIVFTLMPIFARLFATTAAVFEHGGELSATCVICDPLYLPLLNPAFFSIACAFATSPESLFAVLNGSNPKPPAWLKPWLPKSGEMKCVAMSPSMAPPRVSLIEFRSRT